MNTYATTIFSTCLCVLRRTGQSKKKWIKTNMYTISLCHAVYELLCSIENRKRNRVNEVNSINIKQMICQ